VQSTHANKSKPILSITDIPAADRLYLESITKEDAILYQRILQRLQGNGGSSIRGTELFKAIASRAKPSHSEQKTRSDGEAAEHLQPESVMTHRS